MQDRRDIGFHQKTASLLGAILCKNVVMKRPFAATVWCEGKWYVSQCLEVDVASQGETEEEALGSQKGSHVKFVRRLGETVDTAIVPKKSEVPVGSLRSILSQAHIDADDWDKLG